MTTRIPSQYLPALSVIIANIMAVMDGIIVKLSPLSSLPSFTCVNKSFVHHTAARAT